MLRASANDRLIAVLEANAEVKTRPATLRNPQPTLMSVQISITIRPPVESVRKIWLEYPVCYGSMSSVFCFGTVTLKFTRVKSAIFATTRPHFDDPPSFSILAFRNELEYRNFNVSTLIDNHFCTRI